MKYIASPYTHENENVRERRALDVCEFAAALMRSGVHAFSPIAHTHLMSKHFAMPVEFDFWNDYDTEYLKWCDELIVHTQPGWQFSAGISAEIQTMRELGKPVIYACCAASYIQAFCRDQMDAITDTMAQKHLNCENRSVQTDAGCPS